MSNIEDSLKKLEKINEELRGQMELDKALDKYKEGLALTKECSNILKEQKGKLQELVDEMENTLKDFSLEEGIYWVLQLKIFKRRLENISKNK